MGVGNRGESQCRPAGAGNGQGGLSEESARRAVVCRGKDGDGGQSRGGCFATQDSGRGIQRESYARCLRRRCNGRLKFWWDLGRIPVS
jgi:hypothetical protein